MADDKAVAHTVLDSMPEGSEFDAVGDTRREAFANGSCRDEPELVRHKLDDIARAKLAAVDGHAEVFQNWIDTVERLLATANEESQLSVSGSIDCTGYRRVDHADALRGFTSQAEHKFV